ncbi:MAG TPA: MlaD family protein [Baekduia sp.]|nr:MlaD family protein [Baekduia sp.]
MTRATLTKLLVLLAAGVLLVVLWPGGDGRRVRASFPSAINLVPGAEVRLGGLKVGTVRDIELRGGRADVELGIDDDGAWPVRRGTTATIRLGGTVSYANRYVELVPGPAHAPALADGARLPVRDASSPVEFDEVFQVFDPRTRAGLGKLIDTGAATFGPRARELREGLHSAGPAFTQVRGTFEALAGDRAALRTLVRTGAGVAGQLARREGALRALVDDTARTLTAVAAGDGDVRRTLRALPGTLRAARGTLDGADGSLARLDPLLAELRPGGRELRRTAAPLADAVGTLGDVAPELRATLARLRSGGPGIAGFLRAADPQLRRLKPVLERARPMLGCLRRYSPELAGLFSTWAGFNTGYDAAGRFAWLNGQVLPFPNATPLPSKAIADTFAGLRYSLVRPPGLNAGDPQLVPDCGVTADGSDPAKDPEAAG